MPEIRIGYPPLCVLVTRIPQNDAYGHELFGLALLQFESTYLVLLPWALYNAAMARTIQDVKLGVSGGPTTVMRELPMPDGVTMENWVHERMKDHYNSRDGVEAVRVINEQGDVLYLWTFADEQRVRSDGALRKLAETARAELERRKKDS
jgi:hypothetical protein